MYFGFCVIIIWGLFMAIKIYIDQGHNPSGANTGAEGFGVYEQDVTYQVGVYLAELLNANTNFEARLSRNTPCSYRTQPMLFTSGRPAART